MTPDDDLVDAIYATVGRQGSWQDAVELLGHRFHAANGALYAETLPDENSPLALADLTINFGFPGRTLADYAEHFCRVNPFSVHAAHLPTDQPGTESDLERIGGSDLRFAETEFYQDWARPQGVRHVIGQHVQHRDAGRLTVAFWRPADAGAFDTSETAGLDATVRHIRRAIAMEARLRLADAETRTLLDRSGSAIVTLGSDGRIRQCNGAADRLFGDATGLSARDRRLRTAVPQDQAALDRLIACVFDARRRAWAENARVAVRRTDGGRPLVVRIASVAYRFGAFAPDRTASAILTIECFETEAAERVERLRRRFGLTDAQGRLAQTLRSGRSLREAAFELGIGLETARSHLKALFARTDTHRQAELVLLLRDLDDR